MRPTERQMPLLVSDFAKAHEHKQRADAVGRLIRDGHVKVMEDNNPEVIRLRVEDEFFVDPRDQFPTTQMVARLQLAVNAGRSERNRPSEEYQRAVDAARYGMPLGYRSYRVDWAGTMEIGYHNVKQITATVKKKSRQGGLRP